MLGQRQGKSIDSSSLAPIPLFNHQFATFNLQITNWQMRETKEQKASGEMFFLNWDDGIGELEEGKLQYEHGKC